MKKIHGLLIIITIFMVACTSAPKEQEVELLPEESLPPIAEENFEPEPIVEPIIEDPDCLAPCRYPLDAINDSNSELAKRLIFFGYNDSSIKDEYAYTIDQHALYLQSHPSVTVRLEGHTDERGSREYNVALGERRALSVRQVLLLRGVSADQITTVSFGEELPLDLGRDESAWSQNRRVEIVYD